MPSDQITLFEALDAHKSEALPSAPDPEDVFRALTGFSPRPWQGETLRRWISESPDSWGGNCAVPTGLGKSMLPVIALIASAYVVKPFRRIVYVVNRRIVVDQTYLVAKDAAERIRSCDSATGPEGEVLRAFRAMLFARMGLTNPLFSMESENAPAVHLLRGGTGDKLLKVDSPLTPTIIVSTVDQAGSRLLMRGYGVSRKAWPVQAGLLAYDTLWIIDEAHTARPLVTTIGRIRRAIVESSEGALVGRPLVVLKASATLGDGSAGFVPGDDGERHIAAARKNVRLEFLEKPPKSGELARRAVSFVQNALEDEGVVRAAVVVNSINAAREVFAAMTKSLAKHKRQPRPLLLIGAIREHERKAILASEEFADLHPSRRPTKPVVVVATQTVETGPDFDFDALMSETAALDAIIQRFGRANRRGNSPAPQGIIYGCPAVTSPVYGDSPKAAAQVLQSWGEDVLDFSPLDISEKLAKVEPSLLKEAWTPVKHPEALMGARIRDLGRTYPRNRDETDIAWYLHGERAGEVEIIWRNDGDFAVASTSVERATAYATLLPPARGESLSLSTRAARALLRDNTKSDVSDGDDGDGADKKDKDDEQPASEAGESRRAIVIRDGGDVSIVGAQGVRAGDVLIVPHSFGWYDRFGFHPGFKPDTGDAFELIGDEECLAVPDDSLPVRDEDETFTEWSSACIRALHDRLMASSDDAETAFALRMDNAASVSQAPHPVRVAHQLFRIVKSYSCDQNEDSGAKRRVTLEEHHHGVGDRARGYADALGLDPEIVHALDLAGRTHDLGKADEEFQRKRLGNDDATQPLAKSKRGITNVKMTYRHECGSAQMLRHMIDLVRYLVGTHHGYGRPGFPYRDTNRNPTSFTQDGETYAYDGWVGGGVGNSLISSNATRLGASRTWKRSCGSRTDALRNPKETRKWHEA